MAAVIAAAALSLAANAQEQPGFYLRQTSLKTNLAALPLLVANAAIELQPLEHWSLSVPVYYNALDWFSYDAKFRTLATQPEIRYWLKGNLSGLFFNVHATFGWYNVAWGGDYRYQDHAGKSPAFGGGIGIGYKVALGNGPWGLEFGLGGGFLPLHYDYYYNIRGGRIAGEDSRKYFGPDQAFVSLTYSFGKSKKTEL